jgi:SAM-dependent methyltransferase
MRWNNHRGIASLSASKPIFHPGRQAARFRRAMAIAQRDPARDGRFLARIVAADMAARLSAVRRQFTLALDLDADQATFASDVARGELSAQHPEMTIEAARWEDGYPEAGEARYDLAFSLFGLHRANDLPGVLLRVLRALKPDGLFIAALPGDGTLGELRSSLIEAETAVRGGAGLRVEPFAQVRDLGDLLQRAGFKLPVADVERIDLTYGDVGSLVADLRAMGATSALAGPVTALRREVLAELEKIYRLRHATPQGRLKATANIVFLSGWAAHESQQKPLRPGSARESLAKALSDRKPR